MPRGTKAHNEETLSEFLEGYTNPTGLWHNLPAYTVSLLKAYYGQHAHRGNEWGFDFAAIRRGICPVAGNRGS